MINNRQGGRRGRGRNPRPQGGAPRPDQGNRIDNRSRGNANQLYEKYKTLARDAQTQGDRVLTEYYLQFADHYFRVLNESRARFEEQRRTQDNGRDFDGDYEGDDGEAYADGDDGGDEAQQPRRDEGQQRRDSRDDRNQRREFRQPERAEEDGYEREANGSRGEQPRGERQDRGERQERNDRPERGERGDRQQRRPRREFNGNSNGEDQQPQRIDAGVLPPAFGVDASPAPAPAAEAEVIDVAEEAPRRRRTRRPRTEPGTDAPSEAAA